MDYKKNDLFTTCNHTESKQKKYSVIKNGEIDYYEKLLVALLGWKVGNYDLLTQLTNLEMQPILSYVDFILYRGGDKVNNYTKKCKFDKTPFTSDRFIAEEFVSNNYLLCLLPSNKQSINIKNTLEFILENLTRDLYEKELSIINKYSHENEFIVLSQKYSLIDVDEEKKCIYLI